ncbi:hypothetical protein U9R89_21925 [Pectobacterium brasiliense]
MATFVPTPDLDDQLARLLAPHVAQAARTVAAFLRQKMTGPGSGVQWVGQPRPSSAPGEYPAEQTGALVDSLDAQAVNLLHWQAGAFNAPEQAFWLEYPPPPDAPFSKTTAHGARPWISKAFQDPELYQRIIAALL